MLSAPCGSTPILIRAADCLLHAALHRWARSVFDRMRGLALAEIAAVDLDICRLWLVAAPELPFGDQLKAIRCRSHASKTRRSRQRSATSVPSHRSAGFRAAGGTHFAAYSRPLLRSPVTGGKQRGTTHAQRDPRDGGRDIDSMGDQHARITP